LHEEALTPAHLLATILDPWFRGEKLPSREVDLAMELAEHISPKVLCDVVN